MIFRTSPDIFLQFYEKDLTNRRDCDIISSAIRNLGVAQMVARYLGVVEAAGSNPVTQTKYSRTGQSSVLLYFDSQ